MHIWEFLEVENKSVLESKTIVLGYLEKKKKERHPTEEICKNLHRLWVHNFHLCTHISILNICSFACSYDVDGCILVLGNGC